MENNFYENFTKIIRECPYDNTYKMAWAKSLVEICANRNLDEDVIEISLFDIATKYIKYYWNQTIFFDLIQGSNPLRPPVILSLVKGLIEKYFEAIQKKQPEIFEKVEDRFKNIGLEKEYRDTINQVKRTLKFDVSWRFDSFAGSTKQLYEYTKNSDFLYLEKENALILKERELDLYDLINYRWSLILENFNSSPRINKKVRIIDERDIKRSSLTKFRTYLDYENPQHYCFVCGKESSIKELAIDHVIPWSYMYSDDIWNLVYICQHCNSIKSNVIPSKAIIDRLKDRNNRLLNILYENNVKGKIVEELQLAIEKDYVNKFWTGCKG